MKENIKNTEKREIDLENKIKELENIIKDLEIKNKKLENEAKEKNLDKENLLKSEQMLEEKKNKIVELENKIKDLESKNNSFASQIQILEKVEEKKNLGKDPLEFYDIIVDISSMLNYSILNQKEYGWDIRINENGKKILKNNLNKRLVIGVLGDKNKGKSFLLQRFSGVTLQTGTTISTIGLSIKFTEDKFVLLDSAGSESPVLGQSDMSDIREIARDKLIVEEFLQSYIIKYSNALLLVVGQMTFSEQKLINKISGNIEDMKKRRGLKSMIIIHNLQTYETKEEVDNYIENTLKKAFHINKGITNFSDVQTEYYYDDNFNSIKHFIFAKENSEAGNYYNSKTIAAIKSYYNVQILENVFDFEKTLQEHFQEKKLLIYEQKNNSNPTLEIEIIKENINSVNITEKKVKENINNENEENTANVTSEESKSDITDNEEINNKIQDNIVMKKFKIKADGKLILKQMNIDEIGVRSFKTNGFEPDYECYYNKKELVLNVECPEGVQLFAKKKRNRNMSFYNNCLFYIEVTGKKEETKKLEDVTYIREKSFGDYNTIISFPDDNFALGDKIEEEPKNGWKTFKFALSKIEED